jgi:hypothetical protein
MSEDFGGFPMYLRGVERWVATGQKRRFTDGPPVWRTGAGCKD